MTDRITPVVLSGGAGTRLWPVSRALLPKQLLPLVGERSLLAETLARVSPAQPFEPPIVVCNEEHRFLVAEELRRGARAQGRPEGGRPEVGRPEGGRPEGGRPEGGRIVLEPVGRNTAPAACVAALLASERDPAQLVLLLPSDHHIADAEAFMAATGRAARAAREGWLVTFGITPDRPERGFGYIRRAEPLTSREGAGLEGAYRVERFTEKPDRETAEAFLAAGDYSWNSGLYMFRADMLLAEIERLQPDILAACRGAIEGAQPDIDFLRLERGAFETAPSISIDYAVSEKTEKAAVVPVDMGWSDIGSWQGLWSILERDAAGNSRRGDIVALDTRNCCLRSDRGLLAVLGVEDMAVICTDDAVLVCPLDRAPDVGALVTELKRQERPETDLHSLVHRPWGSYRGVDLGEGFQVKRLFLKPGASISLQRHRHRSEHWVVVRGSAEVTRDDEVFRLEVNESSYIPVGAVHRLRNPGEADLEIIEVQTGSYLGEDDIERFEDIYGRTEKG